MPLNADFWVEDKYPGKTMFILKPWANETYATVRAPGGGFLGSLINKAAPGCAVDWRWSIYSDPDNGHSAEGYPTQAEAAQRLLDSEEFKLKWRPF